jgi:hypothetical protein
LGPQGDLIFVWAILTEQFPASKASLIKYQNRCREITLGRKALKSTEIP